MPTTPYLPPPPTTQGSNLSPTDYQWMLIVQGLAALYEVDTSKGSYTEALPAAGVGSSGQTRQGAEIIYIKISSDANTDTITGAITGSVTLKTKWQVARFKSDGTNWYAVCCGSSGGGGGGGGGGVLGKWPGNWIGCNAAAIANGNFNNGANLGMDLDGVGDVAFNAVAPTATSPKGLSSPGGVTASAGILDVQYNTTPGIVADFFTKIALIPSLALRAWFGLTDATNAGAPNTFFSDTPAANFYGFRYSTDVDTTIKAICQTSASHQTVVDTGIAPVSGTAYLLEIVPSNSGATMAFYINGTLVATISTNVPANSTPMATILVSDILDNLSSSGSFNFYYVYCLLNQ